MKILFAVPDRDLLHSYSRLLELDGHEVSCAFDGIQAITLIGSEKFDIAVLGENLPGTELKQLLDLLYGKGIPVAVILGRRVTSGMLCRREIACSYLPLPFLPDEMRTLIRVLIEKKRSGAVFRMGDVSVDSGCFSMEGIRVTNEEIEILKAVSEEKPVSVRNESVYISALNTKFGKLNKASRIRYITGKGYRLVSDNG